MVGKGDVLDSMVITISDMLAGNGVVADDVSVALCDYITGEFSSYKPGPLGKYTVSPDVALAQLLVKIGEWYLDTSKVQPLVDAANTLKNAIRVEMKAVADA